MTVDRLARLFEAKVLCMPNREQTFCGCYAGDLLSHVMVSARPGNLWVTIMSNVNVPAVALSAGISCVIIAEDALPGEDVIKAAKENGVNLISVKETVYDICIKLDELTKRAK